MDTELGETIAELPWFAEGPDIHHEPSSEGEDIAVDWFEWHGLSRIRDIARIDLELAKEIVENSWFAEGPTSDIWMSSLWGLVSLANLDLDLARAVSTPPWLVDLERRTHQNFRSLATRLARKDLEIAKAVFNSAWVNDGVSEHEVQLLRTLSFLADTDKELSRLLVSYPWIIDGLDETETETLRVMQKIAESDVELAWSKVNQPWFSDGVTDAEFVRLALNYPDSFGDLIANVDDGLLRYLVRSLTEIARGPLGLEGLHFLGSKAWVSDGIDDEEAAFITAVSEILNLKLYEDLLDNNFTQTTAISLPLAGDVNVWVFSNAPFSPGEDIPAFIEDIARIQEDFLGVPFPTTNIILLAIDPREGHSSFGQNHNGRRMQLAKYGSDEIGTLPHETAHYYFPGRPLWITEGVAEFMADIVSDHLGAMDLSLHRAEAARGAQSCMERYDFKSIRYLDYLYNDTNDTWEPHVPSEKMRRCFYPMGRNFFHRAFETIGENAMSSALRDFLSERDKGQGDVEETMYRALLEHAPLERKDAFQNMYRKVHGGPYGFPETPTLDDHGDTAADATPIILGEPVQGTLDYFFDFDYFRFRAEEGRKYRMSVSHGTLGAISLGLFRPGGGLSLVDEWEHRKREADGPEIVWVSHRTHIFYFAVRNFRGETGNYTLTIVPVDDASTTSDSGE